MGLYYDLYNDEMNLMMVAGAVGFGLVGGMIAYGLSGGGSSPLIDNVVIRYRMDSTSFKFSPFDYPYLNRTKTIYYYSKYSKGEKPILIKIDEKEIDLLKGTYFEDVLPIREDYNKEVICLLDNIIIDVKVNRTKTSVILFKRKKDGSLTYDRLNENMVTDFLKRKDKLEQINP